MCVLYCVFVLKRKLCCICFICCNVSFDAMHGFVAHYVKEYICNIYIYVSIEFFVALNHTYVHREFDRQPVKCRITEKHGYNVLLVCAVWHRVH